MSRYLQCIILVGFLLGLATCAVAADYTYSLDALLNKNLYPNNFAFGLDTGTSFSNIQSVKLDVRGTAYYAENGSFPPYTIGFALGYPPNGEPAVAGYLTKYGYVGQSRFNISGTWYKGQHSMTDQLLSGMQGGIVNYGFYLMNDIGATTGLGWLDADSATLTITTSPVPEPSSIAALLCGLAGIGSAGLRKMIRK